MELNETLINASVELFMSYAKSLSSKELYVEISKNNELDHATHILLNALSLNDYDHIFLQNPEMFARLKDYIDCFHDFYMH